MYGRILITVLVLYVPVMAKGGEAGRFPDLLVLPSLQALPGAPDPGQVVFREHVGDVAEWIKGEQPWLLELTIRQIGEVRESGCRESTSISEKAEPWLKPQRDGYSLNLTLARIGGGQRWGPQGMVETRTVAGVLHARGVYDPIARGTVVLFLAAAQIKQDPALFGATEMFIECASRRSRALDWPKSFLSEDCAAIIDSDDVLRVSMNSSSKIPEPVYVAKCGKDQLLAYHPVTGWSRAADDIRAEVCRSAGYREDNPSICH